jgi:hypothetical protein
MIGVDAGPNVSTRAVVQNTQSFWNRSAMDQPAKPVRFDSFPINTPSPNRSVSFFIFGPYPQPTGIGLVNIFPESFYDGFVTILGGQYWIGVNESLPSNTVALKGDSNIFGLHSSLFTVSRSGLFQQRRGISILGKIPRMATFRIGQ